MEREATRRAAFWELFRLRGRDALPEGLLDSAAANREFTLANVCPRGGGGEPASPPAPPSGESLSCSQPACLYTMGFRCASLPGIAASCSLCLPLQILTSQ